MTRGLDSIFKPKSVAVVGASTNPEKLGYQILENIINAGFEGKIYPLNPKATDILGLNCINDPANLPEGVDLAVVIIPAGVVPGTLDKLGEKKVGSAIIITGGFAESGEEGEKLQKQVVEISARRNIRVIGPNCQGVNYAFHNLCASWPLITLKGDMAIISQSGTVGAALIDWASEEKIGFSAFVSMGNRADVDESELIEYFSEDPNTKVITLYIEGVKNPGKFQRSIEKSKKPIVIFKAGRTARGKIAAESHTKSLAGRDEIYNALFKKYGVVRALDIEELYDYSKALAYFPQPPGNRMLIVTSSGGAAIIAIDVAEELGFSVGPMKPEAANEIAKVIPPHCITVNPIDLTGDADAAMFKKVMDMAEKDYDIIMPIFGDPVPGAAEIVSPDKCHLVAYLGGADVEREERVKMGERKIAVFPTPERAVKAASAYLKLGKTPKREDRLVHEEEKIAGKMLTPVDAFSLLERYHIPVSPYFKVKTADEVEQYGKSLGFPVVLKVNSSDVIHKSDEKGVVLNIQSAEEGKREFTSLAERFQKKGVHADGMLLAKQMPPGTEVIYGVTKDEQFGHALAFGLGGIFVEVIKDVTFRMLPLSNEEMSEMIQDLKGKAIFQGFRGMPPADMEAIADLGVKISRLIGENPQIAELDINPVFVYEKGLCVLDARVILSS